MKWLCETVYLTRELEQKQQRLCRENDIDLLYTKDCRYMYVGSNECTHLSSKNNGPTSTMNEWKII